MARRKGKKRRKKERIKTPEVCYFCKNGTAPDYKEFKILEGFITNRAKIIGRERSGICTKHQRRLAKAIKRARHLGLLPFASSI